MDISRERKTIEMSEISGLNSAVSCLVGNTLELFTPTAETKSAGVRHSGDHPYVCVQEETGVSEAYNGVFLRDKELLSNFEVIRLCVFMTLLNDHKSRGHKSMQTVGENVCGS